MTQKEYFTEFEKECKQELQLTISKNTDYANENDAFKNFKGIEFLTDGKVTLEEGIITRLTDKFQRVINLLERENAVKNESITDTLRDISVYAKILRIYLLKVKNAEHTKPR